GPLAVALTYDRMEAPVTDDTVGTNSDGLQTLVYTAVDTEDIQSYNLGLAYDFEVVKLHLAAGQTKDGVFNQQAYGASSSRSYGIYQAARGLKVNSYMVGLSAPVGAGKVMASWHMADPTDAPDGYTGAALEKQNTFSLGYTYNLSKRTNLYAIGSYAKDVNFR